MIRENRPGGGADRTREEGFYSDRLSDEARDTAREIAEEAKVQVQDAAHKISESGKQIASEQKSKAAQIFNDLSQALRDASDQLSNKGDQMLASYSRTLADQCDRVCRYLEDHGPGELFDDVRGLVRRRPEVFLGGMFLVGLGVARFFKASSKAQESQSYGYGYSGESLHQETQYAGSAATSSAGAGISGAFGAERQDVGGVSESIGGAGSADVYPEPGGPAVGSVGGPISDVGSDPSLPQSHFAEPKESDIPAAMRELDEDIDLDEFGPSSRSPDRPDYPEEI